MKFDRAGVCERCFRPKFDCFCGKVVSFDNKIAVTILQHPQEQLKVLNSARLAHLLLKHSRIFVGLSWSNFKKVAGPEALPSEWGVLYLKPYIQGEKLGNRAQPSGPVMIVNRKKQPIETTAFLRGIIAIDGSWKQAKTLWWRNPWLLKLNRISLNPDHPSMRPQVKEEGLSTIEAIALTLEYLGENPEIAVSLRTYYQNLIIGDI